MAVGIRRCGVSTTVGRLVGPAAPEFGIAVNAVT